MGFGVITGGGTDGLYTISLDYGASVRDAMIAERNARIAELEAEIVTVSAEAADARAATAAAGAAMNDAINAYTDALNGIPDGTPEELAANIARTSKEVQEAFELLNRLQNEELVPRLKIQMLRERVSELRAEVVRLTNATLSETRQAWCVDLTEDGTGEVATIEIPGETSAVLIASGCKPWGASDGVMMAREIMSPEQVFWNAAVLPGWQKFKPTYRKGTITAVDAEADTASVSLDNATSSAQQLGVNQSSSLSGVPITYMDCNAKAFEAGDRCIVQFSGQNWTSPLVIGFVDNPKPCTRVSVLFYRDGETTFSSVVLYETSVYMPATVTGATTPATIDSVAWNPLSGQYEVNGTRNFLYWDDNFGVITSYSLTHPDIETALPKLTYIYRARYEPVID